MKKFIDFIRSDKIIFRGTLVSVGILSLHLTTLLIVYRFLPPYVPIYNQLPWGVERLGSRLELFLPFALTVVLLFVNLIIMNLLYEKLPLLSRMLGVTTLLTALLGIIFTLRIIQLIM